MTSMVYLDNSIIYIVKIYHYGGKPLNYILNCYGHCLVFSVLENRAKELNSRPSSSYYLF